MTRASSADHSAIDLTVCIVAWNGWDLTRACIESLIAQTRGIRYEILLVDNGSTDGTSALAEQHFPGVRLIRNATNHGFPAANNQALRLARGRYSVLLNNDMVFTTDALSRMVAFMDGHDDVGVLGCRLRYPDGRVQFTAHGDKRWQDHLFQALFLHRLFPYHRQFGNIDCTYLPLDADDGAFDVGYVAGAALLVRGSAMSEVGLLDERILFNGEDWEWCRRFARYGHRVVYYLGAEIIHYHGVSTIRYEGAARHAVRWRSVMYLTATSHYVYRKLHPNDPVRVQLFSLCFRLHWLTRTISHSATSLLRGRFEKGVVKAFWAGATTSYAKLAAEFLQPETVEAIR